MKQTLKNIYRKAVDIAFAVDGWHEDYLDIVQIDSNGEVSVSYSNWNCGEVDHHTFYLQSEDLEMDIDMVVLKYKKIEQEKQEHILKQKEIEKQKEEEKANILKEEKEKEEFETYQKLKQKFEK